MKATPQTDASSTSSSTPGKKHLALPGIEQRSPMHEFDTYEVEEPADKEMEMA